MGKTRNLDMASPGLQLRCWPPVNAFAGLTPYFTRFLTLPHEDQQYELRGLSWDRETHGCFLNQALGTINAYQYGYRDSPCYLQTDDALETRLLQTKIVLERELMEHWLPTRPAVRLRDQKVAAEYLRDLATHNPAVVHPLYEWLAAAASRQALMTFLDDEVIRNEVVDDEVAKLVCGHQGLLKSMAGINLTDELGRGKLEHAHTYWLRLYLEQTEGWERLRRYRRQDRPWFTNIMSNVFNMTLTRPGLKFAAYGHFLMTEALVCPHFEKLLDGMRRLDLCQDSSGMYFTAHAKLDPYHAEELMAGLALQEPALMSEEIDQIVLGAHWAISGALEQYDRVLKCLQARTSTSSAAGGGSIRSLTNGPAGATAGAALGRANGGSVGQSHRCPDCL